MGYAKNFHIFNRLFWNREGEASCGAKEVPEGISVG
jgi:hypothetical protein